MIVAIIAVGFFMLGLSITLMVKGRNLQSEVGENDDMKRLGIKCTSQQIMEDEAMLTGKTIDIGNCDVTCGTCKTVCGEN